MLVNAQSQIQYSISETTNFNFGQDSSRRRTQNNLSGIRLGLHLGGSALLEGR